MSSEASTIQPVYATVTPWTCPKQKNTGFQCLPPVVPGSAMRPTALTEATRTSSSSSWHIWATECQEELEEFESTRAKAWIPGEAAMKWDLEANYTLLISKPEVLGEIWNHHGKSGRNLEDSLPKPPRKIRQISKWQVSWTTLRLPNALYSLCWGIFRIDFKVTPNLLFLGGGLPSSMCQTLVVYINFKGCQLWVLNISVGKTKYTLRSFNKIYSNCCNFASTWCFIGCCFFVFQPPPRFQPARRTKGCGSFKASKASARASSLRLASWTLCQNAAGGGTARFMAKKVILHAEMCLEMLLQNLSLLWKDIRLSQLQIAPFQTPASRVHQDASCICIRMIFQDESSRINISIICVLIKINSMMKYHRQGSNQMPLWYKHLHEHTMYLCIQNELKSMSFHPILRQIPRVGQKLRFPPHIIAAAV